MENPSNSKDLGPRWNTAIAACCGTMTISCGAGLLAGTLTIIGGIALFALSQQTQAPTLQFWTRFTSISALVAGSGLFAMPFVSICGMAPCGYGCGLGYEKIKQSCSNRS